MRRRLGYVKQRLTWVLRYAAWWRLGLLGALLVSGVLAATTTGPVVVWVVIAWGCITTLLVTAGARLASTHARVAGLEKQRSLAPADGSAPDVPALKSRSVAAVAGAARQLEATAGAVPGHGVWSTGAATDGHEDRPLVTVVVPCYNDERFLADCIRSIRRQTFRDWECIVVDDASTDGSTSVAVEAGRGDKRVKVITRGRNGGLSAARNTGMLAGRGHLVTFVDSDDLLFKDSLQHRVSRMVELWKRPDVAGVFCGVRQDSETVTFDELGASAKWKAGKTRDFLSTRGECPFNAHAPLLWRELLIAVGGFDESMLHGAEDWDLWLRLMRHGYCFEPVPLIGAVYRQRQGSMVKRMPTKHLAEAQRLLRSAHQPLDPALVRVAGPCIFDRPVGEHLADADLANRVLQFAGMAAVTDDQQLDAVLAEMPPVPLVVLNRRVDVRGSVRSGIRRGLCLGVSEFRVVGPSTDETCQKVLDRAAAAVTAHGAAPEPRPGPVVDVCVVAPNAGTVLGLIEVLDGLGLGAAFVSIEAESGNQGATDRLTAMGHEVISLNAYRLAGRTHRVLLTAVPYGRAIADLVGATRAEGGIAVEVAASDVAHLDDNPLHGDVGVAPERAREILGQLSDPPVAFAAVTQNVASAGGIARIEESPDLPFDGASLTSLHNRFAGERCVIVGNGPSLNQLDLALLESTPFFAVNGIFHAGERLPCPPTFYVVEDTSVARENTQEIIAYEASYKFFPTIYRELFGAGDNWHYFRMNRGFYASKSPHYCVPRFSTDAAQRVYCGQSVTIINLQLAHYLGFEEVILIGMDFSYVIPDDADRDGDLITSRSDDVNHFHPAYFGTGKTWKDPKLDRVLVNYQMAKSVYEATGRRILNATPGGNLHVFDRVDFAHTLP